jgi:glycosyltransferase involved in cell wall biosynthesis
LGNYFAIVTSRNSEAGIKSALLSLKNQALRPEYVIVIDDGSKDSTPEILKELERSWSQLFIITNPDMGYDIKRVVKNWNAALELVRNRNMARTDYHLIATDDTEYASDYAFRLISYLDSNPDVAIASGNYTNHKPEMPHGAGRYVRNSVFEKTRWNGSYPEQMGYESAILYEVELLGYKYSVIEEARFRHLRPLGLNHRFYEFGASMHTLGYHPAYALGRFAKYFSTGAVTGRLGSLYMIYYYLTYKAEIQGYNRLYDAQFRQYVRKKQIDRLKRILNMRILRK